MRIIKPLQLRHFAEKYPDARQALERWLMFSQKAEWTLLVEVRKVFRDADEVIVISGRPVVIFNIGGNKYRLIVAVHYNRSLIYVMKFMTHAQYSKDAWKGTL